MNPEVSIIIPTYNSENYIAKALKSVLNQTYSNFEIILIDDASSDSTVDIARSFNDKRLKIIANKYNRGVSYGRNCGIKQAKGQWIALLDSDDWYAPQRLERLLSVAKKRCVDMIADNLLLIQEQATKYWSTLLQENAQDLSSAKLINAVEFVTSDRPSSIGAKRNWSLGYLKPLIRKEFLIKNNIWYDEALNVGEDFSFYLECLRHRGRFYLIPEAYYYYQTRSLSLSTRKPTEYLSQSCEITQRFINQENCVSTDSKLLEALAQNLAAFERRLAYHHLLENIMSKKIQRIYQQIVEKPYLLADVTSRLLYVFVNKLASKLDLKKVYQNINASYPKKPIFTSEISK
ncbi:glycosyltransferase family 2 protein [Pleurocapsa sp. FMAR1]|uniref:glycosyltransferase family 2 protein n=1 Tax=Pleurocapsa sp. FMAR1 TaxID=3040204 RepID=UPI0029C66263|nr:glycosyltransferase family 2 protein [Pleurocapsa sp. FMAR1]